MNSGLRAAFSLAAAFLSVWLGIRFLLPLCAPFLVGGALALSAEPLVGLLHKKLHVPRGISAGIGVSMAFSLLAMALLLLCAFLVRELRMLVGVLPDLENAARSGIGQLRIWLQELASHAPRSVAPVLQENIAALLSDGSNLLDKGVRFLLGLAGNLLSHIPDSALGLATSIISGYMISAKLPRIQRWIRRRIPRQRMQALIHAGQRIRSTVSGWLLAQLKLMSLTFFILAVGLLILKIPYAPLWALGICLVDAFPVLGTGTILLPWALVCRLQEDTPRAVGLLGIYVVITLTRSAMEPKLLGRHLGLDPLVTLFAMYAGFQIWGIGGMVFAPMVAVCALQLSPNSGKPR